MNQFVHVLGSLLPVVIALLLGVLACKTRLLDDRGAQSLKTVVSRITLPFVIFQAFLSADYGADMAVVFLVVLALCLITFGAGFFLRKRIPGVNSLLPFTVSGYEMGMLGYPLFSILAGQEHMGSLAKVDLGQVLFVFTIYLLMLRRQTGGRKNLKEALGEVVTNPVMMALLLGLLLGVTGLSAHINASPAGTVIRQITSFIGAPTATLILLAIGYEFKLDRQLFKSILQAILLRLGLTFGAGLPLTLVMFLILPYSPWLLMAMLTMMILPAPFVLPVYSENEQEKDFVSAYLSAYTMLSMVLFALLLVIKPLMMGC